MATYCTGVTATWNGVAFGEVSEIAVRAGGGLPQARACTWSPDAGTVTLKCLGSAHISRTSYGLCQTLSLGGGGFSSGSAAFTTKAILRSFDMDGKVNDVARYGVTLQIHNTTTTAS
jgi:hypothetical protein